MSDKRMIVPDNTPPRQSVSGGGAVHWSVPGTPGERQGSGVFATVTCVHPAPTMPHTTGVQGLGRRGQSLLVGHQQRTHETVAIANLDE